MRAVSVAEIATKPSIDTKYQFVDVRSPSEFASGHLPGAISIPLEQLPSRTADLNRNAFVVLVCQSGRRAEMAAEHLDGSFQNVAVLAGGTAAWRAAGHTVTQTSASSWSLDRQVRLGAGLLILTTLTLAQFISTKWLLGTAFIGAGLTFAGATDICGMGLLLAKMPWNRARTITCVRS